MFKKRTLNDFKIIYCGYDKIFLSCTDMEEVNYGELYSIEEFRKLLENDFKFLKIKKAEKKSNINYKLNIDSWNVHNIKNKFIETYGDIFDSAIIANFNEDIEGSKYNSAIFFNKDADEIIILSIVTHDDNSIVENKLNIGAGISFASTLDIVNLDILNDNDIIYTVDIDNGSKAYIKKDFASRTVCIYVDEELIFAIDFEKVKLIEAGIYAIFNSVER